MNAVAVPDIDIGVDLQPDKLARRVVLAADQRRRPEFRVDDLLFLGIEDVVSGRLDQTAIEERRRKYLGDASYLARHAIKPGRLTAILET